MEVARLVRVLELDGRMVNAELVGQNLSEAMSDAFAFGGGHIQDPDMTGESA
jgi:hypothetical protein